ncbi:hypothetical protein GGR58DRAFT_460318 [Xylaria digitata]|nr:hypothetical protein GGR58DRAFT_460318 [Xylaria digitata]
MLIRRVWTQAPRAPSLSTACVSRHVYAKIQDHHINTKLPVELHNHEQPSRAYSNYAPRGPPPYYNMYGQPPKSRASRLKDMAIGSILTITVYFAYIYWELRDELKEMEEEEERASMVNEIFLHYQQLLEKAEKSDDGSPESLERIHSILKERAMAFARKVFTDGQDDQLIEDLGPLPKIPEGRLSPEVQRIEDKDTLVLMPPPPSADKSRVIDESNPRRGPHSWDQVVSNNIVVAVNVFSEDSQVRARERWQTDPDAAQFREIIARSMFMVDKLRREGVLRDGGVEITVILRNEMFSFFYDENDLTIPYSKE